MLVILGRISAHREETRMSKDVSLLVVEFKEGLVVRLWAYMYYFTDTYLVVEGVDGYSDDPYTFSYYKEDISRIVEADGTVFRV